MLKKILSILALFILTTGYFSCSEESNPEFDQNNFTKIYDNSSFTAAYYPIDVQQTEDGGYIILAGTKLENSQFFGTYLMKADKEGNFVSELHLDENLVGPVGRLMKVGDTYTFFCMENLTQATQMISIDGNVENLTVTPVNGHTYPAVAALDGTSFIILGYNNTDNESVIATVNSSGGITQSKAFSIGAGGEEGVEEPIINHYIRSGKKFPFQVGKSGGTYFFNGFFNYSFSLVFTDLNADDPQGVVQGIHDDGGLGAVVPIAGTKFAASRFNFGENFTLPNVTLNTSGISSSVNLGGNSFPELEFDAPIKILRATGKSKNVLVYASNTRSKQIGLYFHDEATGEFISSRYLGFSNPYEIANLTVTEDGGLAICGTTYLAGRFPRICLFKLSKKEFESQL